MTKTPILGGYDVGRSLNSVDAQLINLYLEIVENQDGKTPGTLYTTPGLDLFATCGTGPINGMSVFQGKLNVISNNSAYQVSTSGVVTANGTIGGSPITTPVSMVTLAGEGSSGPTQTGQLGVFTGAAGYYSTGGNFSQIALPNNLTMPLVATEYDTFVVVSQQGMNVIWQSNATDLTGWSALAFAFADALSGNIVALKMVNRLLYVLKTDSTEIWTDQGTSPFAFARLSGPFTHYGCAAALSAARLGDGLCWLTRTKQGQGQVVQAYGVNSPARISNHAIERQIQSYGDISDAIAYCYQQEGHAFYVLTFPSANVTWVYDGTASAQLGIPIWHQRAAFNPANGQFSRHQGNCYAFFNGMDLIGDWRSGNIYSLNLNTLTDAGAQRKWLRTWRALAEPVYTPRRFDSLQIDMQTGVGVPPNTSPELYIRWSDDGGHKWSNPVFGSAGALGKTAQRIKFNRLGSTRLNNGLDRIFELSSTDQFAVGLMGAEITP